MLLQELLQVNDVASVFEEARKRSFKRNAELAKKYH
jgi:hypothetical protein